MTGIQAVAGDSLSAVRTLRPSQSGRPRSRRTTWGRLVGQGARLEASGRLHHGPTRARKAIPMASRRSASSSTSRTWGVTRDSEELSVVDEPGPRRTELLGPILHRATRRVARGLGDDVSAAEHGPRILEPVGTGDGEATGRRGWRCLATDVACTSMEWAPRRGRLFLQTLVAMMVSQRCDDRGASPARPWPVPGERPGDEHTRSEDRGVCRALQPPEPPGAWCVDRRTGRPPLAAPVSTRSPIYRRIGPSRGVGQPLNNRRA